MKILGKLILGAVAIGGLGWLLKEAFKEPVAHDYEWENDAKLDDEEEEDDDE